MKLTFAILISQLLLSCNNDSHLQLSDINDTSNTYNDEALSNEKFTILPDIILKDFTTWYDYSYKNVRLSQDFIGLDIDSIGIDKATFLNKLINGNAVAFKIQLLQGTPVYKLYKLNSSDKSITSTIVQLASIEMKNFNKEGKQLPLFDLTDLNGKNYNAASTKGKIVILKCWFIHCVSCVQEFPECNDLVDEYKDINKVLFISLTRDTKEDLTKFLKTRQFKYAVIPEMDNYMTTQLDINQYPTHLLIDATGKILKVVNSIEELKPFLKKEVEKHV